MLNTVLYRMFFSFWINTKLTPPPQLVMSAIVEIKGKNKVDRNEIEFRFETSSFLPSTTVARFVCQQTLLAGKSIDLRLKSRTSFDHQLCEIFC